jgi:hypothetical protein
MATTTLNAWVPFVNVRDALLDPVTKLVEARWQEWFLALWNCVNNASQQQKRVTLTAQGASIAATAIPLAKIDERIYHVSVFARVTRAGSVSSSLAISIRGIDGGVTYDRVIGTVTTNTTASILSAVVPMKTDKDGPISYLTTYADGGGATSMQYSLDIIAEALPS